MSDPARRERSRALRTSMLVRREGAAIWGLDWAELAEQPDGDGFRLAIRFVSSTEEALPPGLSVDDFAIETASGVVAAGWELSELDAQRNPVAMRLDRGPGFGPWTEPSLVVVYRGGLEVDANVVVDPASDRLEVFFAPLAPPGPAAAPRALSELQPIGDYSTTRAGLLHRLALTHPEWQERSEADPWMVLVELLAWAGDQLAGYQDAVATEAWLETARQRLSLRRHARLLGYFVHDGCSARAWIKLCPTSECTLRAGTVFASKRNPEPHEPDVRWFHALGDRRLAPELDELRPYTWGVDDWVLPAGTTRFALAGHVRGLGKGALLAWPGPHVARIAHLKQQTDPVTGSPITQVELFAEDALPADVRAATVELTANVALVADGLHFTFREPPELGSNGSLRYRLRGRRLAVVEPFDAAAERGRSASRALRLDPERALPDLDVIEQRPGGERRRWELRRDLLGSGPYDRHVVAEVTEHELILRFGDAINGRPAPSPSLLVVAGREVGPRKEAARRETPLHALGGAPDGLDARVLIEAEPVAELRASDVRSKAPQAARRFEACRVGADYVRRVRAMDGVLDAYADIRWTGSWYTAYVWVLPVATDSLDEAFAAEIRRKLRRARMLGVDLDVRAARHVFGDISLEVVVERGARRSTIEKALRARLGPSDFFERTAWRLGASVSRGALVSAACAVRGVKDVGVLRFRRDDEPSVEVVDWIRAAPHEAVRIGVGGAASVELRIVEE